MSSYLRSWNWCSSSGNELGRHMKRQFDIAIKEDRLRPNEGMRRLHEYEKGLKEYPYLHLLLTK